VLRGILNGIDVSVWDPSRDARLASLYNARNAMTARPANKAALQRRFGLKQSSDAMLFGIVSRLTEQKGLDLVIENLSLMLESGMQLVLLGQGDEDLHRRFETAAKAHPEQIGVVIGYDEDLAHLLQAGIDALLVPSRFEPCGLTQLYAMRYGAIPVVARVGGLADTVIDANEMAVAAKVATGVQFGPVTRTGLGVAIRRAASLFRHRSTWQRMRKNGMTTDVSWRNPARHYAELYRQVADLPSGQ
jgi:starch synthase